METTHLTRDEILKRMITRASNSLILDVYARIEEDWKPWGVQLIRPDVVKSWEELVVAAVREGALAIEEAALLLDEVKP